MTGLDRECLGFAWEIVDELKGDKELGKSVLRYSRRAGGMLLSDGLPATLAFAYSKSDDGWRKICEAIVKWLNKRDLLSQQDPLNVLKELSEMEEWKVSIVDRDAMRLLGWLCRLCEGRFGGED